MKRAQPSETCRDLHVAQLLGIVEPGPQDKLPKLVIKLADDDNRDLWKYATSQSKKYTLIDRIERVSKTSEYNWKHVLIARIRHLKWRTDCITVRNLSAGIII